MLDGSHPRRRREPVRRIDDVADRESVPDDEDTFLRPREDEPKPAREARRRLRPALAAAGCRHVRVAADAAQAR